MIHHAPTETQLEQLATAYPHMPEDVFERLAGKPDFALLPDTPGEGLPYIRPNPGSETPLFIVPGWGVGRIRRLAFAGALAAEGVDVILPGQNRSYADRSVAPSLYHARNYQAVLEQEGLLGQPVDFVAQSFGCLVLETLVQDMEQKRPGSLKDSAAILIAPMGLLPDPKTREKQHRFRDSHLSELPHDMQDFPDHGIHMLWANEQILKCNRRLSINEDMEMRNRQIDFAGLSRVLARVVIMTHKEDRMLPLERIETAAQQAVEAGATWLNPYSLRKLPDGSLRGGRGATHNDEQFTPERVVGAMLQVLQPEPRLAASI